MRRRREFVIGLAIGLILSIILTIIQATRRIGLGMLVAIVVSPIIFFIGCLVAISSGRFLL